MLRVIQFITRSGFGRALRHRIFAIYICAHAASVLGLWIQRIAIQWLAWSLTESYAWLGAVALAEALANMTFSIVSGPLADKFDRVRIANITQGLLLIVALLLALVTYMGWISIPILTGFVIVMGILEGVWAPVRLSIMPNLVPKEDMSAAVAITSMMFTSAIFIGPALGGVIITFASVEGAFVANAISYLGLLLVFVSIKMPPTTPIERKPQSFLYDLRDGFGTIIRSSGLRSIVLFAAFYSFLIRPYRELFAGMADEVFSMGAEGLAALASAAGFGALVGAILIALHGRTQGLVTALYVVSAISGIVLAVFTYVDNLYVALSCVAILSACVTVFGTGAQMLIQTYVSDNFRGRVMSVWSAQFRGIPAVGAWCIGLLEASASLQSVLLSAALGFLLVMAILLLAKQGFAKLETR
ncbi:MFS transporter [Aurantivibrio plasticivorans]